LTRTFGNGPPTGFVPLGCRVVAGALIPFESGAARWSPRAIASRAIRAVGVRVLPAGVARIRFAISCLLGGVFGDAADPAIAPAAMTTIAMVSTPSVRRMLPPSLSETCP